MTAGPTLLAFDFDGTLAPIRDDPAEVRLSRGAAELLAETTRIRNVAVAIASGRDADDIASRADVTNAYVIGSHGLEVRGPGGVVIRDQPPLDLGIDPALAAATARLGLRLERKKHAIALHWRGHDEESVQPWIGAFRAWASRNELDLIEGRSVIEARIAGGGKEEAVRWLASAIGAARVFYAGDDLTDFGALQFASERGRGVFVANGERTPPPNVTVVDSFRELFRLVREEVLV